jgi:Phosphotransferase enzyme family
MTRTVERPSDRALVRSLEAALGEPGGVALREREPNSYASTFPSDVVTCETGSRTVALLCKYEVPRDRGVRGVPVGVRYESDAYRSAVEPARLSAPRWFGLHSDEPAGPTWLMLEFLAETLRLDKSPERGGLSRAARWIGSFHRFHDLRAKPPPECLNREGPATFRACVARATDRWAELHATHPWFHPLARDCEAVFCDLFVRRPTVIHGEFYPSNILVRDGLVFPVDWERAAVSAGEIDFAALTEGWKPEEVRLATESYVDARWDGDAPDDFDESVEAARVHLHLQSLGDLVPGPFKAKDEWRLEHLRTAAESRGLA